MNNRKSKELRKQARKQTEKMVKGTVQQVIFKTARHRDIVIIVAAVEFIAIVVLAVFLIRGMV